MRTAAALLACSVVATLFPAPARAQAPAAAGPLVIAGPAPHTPVIVIADGWEQHNWSDWGGHAILRAWLKEVTGIDVPVVPASEVARPGAAPEYTTRIWVGRQPEVERVMGAALDKLDDDGFIVRAVGRDLYVAGKRWWGDNWAAHEVLERFAGCRWYGPEKAFHHPERGIVGLFDVIPRRDRVEVPAGTDVVQEPGYKMRWFRFMPLHSFRLRYRDQFHHALVGIIDPRKLGDAHPEYFPLVGGKRFVPPPGQEIQFQPCASNADVVRLVAGAAIDHFKQNPESGAFSVGMNDTDKFCECDACLAIAPESITDKQQRIAYAFFDFYNRIAREVEAAGFGDKRLGCLGYAGLSVLPPGSIRMHRMLVPYLTRDSAQLFDPNQVNEFRDIVRTWSGLATRMGIYEYVYGGGYVVPRVYNRYLIRNVREHYGVGCDGFYAESYPNWGLDGPKYWLLARMLWDPKQDPEALLGAWYRDLFGPTAGATMRAYFDLLEETWCTQTLASDRSNYRWMLDPRQLEIFPPAVCERAWALLERAEREAGADEVVKRRVAFFRDAFAVTRALSRRHAAAAAVDRAVAETRDAAWPASVSTRLAAIGAWYAAPPAAPALQRALANPDALDTTVIANAGGFDRFERQPVEAVSTVIGDAVARALGDGQGLTRDGVSNRIAEAFEVPAEQRESRAAADRLKAIAAAGGVLFVPPAARAPSVDGTIGGGTIGANEWPGPATEQTFFRAHRLDPVAERTHVRACRSGDELFLAFDCEQDPATVGAAATGADTGGWESPAMVDDDCMVLTFTAPGRAFRSVRVNVNGAVGFHQARWDEAGARAAARKTATGWQAEVAIKLSALEVAAGVGPVDAPDAPHWTVAVARYTRRAVAAAGGAPPGVAPAFRAEASTILPAPPGAGIIGRGNHPELMTFTTGPRLLFVAE